MKDNIPVGRLIGAIAFAFILSVVSCATTSQQKFADRDAINREMPLIAEYEGKRNELKKAVNVLATNGLFDTQSGKEVKESLDIEYVYYEASIISLARGDMDEYRNYVALAQKELDRAKSAVVARVQTLNRSPQGEVNP
ncbi:MAG TPA: hypothetical protein VHM64_11350 [Candidatus Binatia bacterium]|nr:hypothetical protein [Candidatus Binatia bacterium]